LDHRETLKEAIDVMLNSRVAQRIFGGFLLENNMMNEVSVLDTLPCGKGISGR
jgi:hypothetical protein